MTHAFQMLFSDQFFQVSISKLPFYKATSDSTIVSGKSGGGNILLISPLLLFYVAIRLSL